MRSFRDITEAKGLVVMAFGRMNPPTIGHLKLADKVKSIAGSNPYRIYLSQTTGPKDPLPFPKKVAYAKKSFGTKHAKSIMADKSVKTFIQAAQKLNEEGYTQLIMVAGSDRIQEFQRLLDTYNGKPDKKGNVVFDFTDGVKVISSGERDPDSADPTEAISASVMRKAAQDGDFDTFKKGSPLKELDAKKMYLDVRKFMGVREERELDDDYDSLRDAYLTGKIWNVGEVVEANGVSGEVVRKGTNYLSFVADDGKVHKAWLHDIVGVKPMSGPTGQIFALKSEEVELDESIKVTFTRGKVAGDIKEYKNEYEAKRAIKELQRKGYEIRSVIDNKGNNITDRFVEDVELDERNYAKEYANYQGTPEQIARRSSRNKARRAMGDKAVKGQDVGHKDNNPLNNDPENLRNEDPSKNRREPRLREKPELDEMTWYKVALAKISQMSHPRGYEKMVKQYAADMKKPELKNKTASYIAATIASGYRGMDGRKLVQYINKLVDAGKLPKELKAELQAEDAEDDKLQKTMKIANAKMNLARKINQTRNQQKDSLDRVKGKDGKKSLKKSQNTQLKNIKTAAKSQIKTLQKMGEKFESFKSFVDRIQVQEVLGSDASQKDYIDDFIDSDAPQFAGKSKKERIAMAIAAFRSKNEEEGPCWDGYKQLGMKMKNGKQVPNCVPEEFNEWGEITEADAKSGKELNNPTKGDVKKYKVYVKNDKGNVVKVEFGDPNMSIKRDDPKARANFRARHNCDQKKDRTTAGYWSCKFWSTKSVTDLMKG